MVQLPTVSESDTRDAFVATPLGDYELVDFGNGRKLERWGDYVVERPDREATGEPAQRNDGRKGVGGLDFLGECGHLVARAAVEDRHLGHPGLAAGDAGSVVGGSVRLDSNQAGRSW